MVKISSCYVPRCQIKDLTLDTFRGLLKKFPLLVLTDLAGVVQIKNLCLGFTGSTGKGQAMAKKAEAAETTEPKFGKEAGRGKKLCPGCGFYVGARVVGKCPNPECNHEFTAKEKTERREVSEAGGLTLEDLWVLEDKLGVFMSTEIGEGKVKAKLTPVQLLQFVNDVDEMQVQVGGIGNLVKFIQRQIDKAVKK